MVPAALAAPAMSLLGDRYPRRNVLLVLALARAAVLAAAAVLVWREGPAVVVFVLAAAFTAIGTGHKPAQAALLPSLADDPRQLAACNALWSTVDSVGFLAGAVAGGLLIAAGGVELALAVTSIAFLVAALALAGIPADRGGERPPLVRGRRAEEFAEGFRAVAAERRLRLVVAVLGVSTLVEGAIDVLVVIVALELLHLGAAGVGWLNSAWGVGGVIGGAGAVLVLVRGRNASAIAIASLLIGAPLIALAAVPEVGVAVLGLVVLGVGYAVMEVAGLTLVQRLASDAVLARAFGVVEGTYWLTTGHRLAAGAAARGHARPAQCAGGGRRDAARSGPGQERRTRSVGGLRAGAGAGVRAAARGRACSRRCPSSGWRNSRGACTRFGFPPAPRSSARASTATAST